MIAKSFMEDIICCQRNMEKRTLDGGQLLDGVYTRVWCSVLLLYMVTYTLCSPTDLLPLR